MMPQQPKSQRVAYSPGEFAELFGKSQTWGYRQIYSGKVHAITEYGRILIPAKEVERVLEKAGIYNGKEKPKAAKAREEKLSPEQKNIWQRFVRLRSEAQAAAKPAGPEQSQKSPRWKSATRNSVLSRIASKWSDKGAGR
jgi:hypothetical protein